MLRVVFLVRVIHRACGGHLKMLCQPLEVFLEKALLTQLALEGDSDSAYRSWQLYDVRQDIGTRRQVG